MEEKSSGVAAREELFLANRKLAYFMATKFIRKDPRAANHDREDIEQEALIGLWKATAPGKFDPAKGKFSTYAAQAIKNSMIRLVKKLHKIEVELEEGELRAPPCQHAHVEDPSTRNYRRQVLLTAANDLTLREARVITLRFAHNQTRDEIGAILQLSRERIRQIEIEALGKMQRALLRAGVCGVEEST